MGLLDSVLGNKGKDNTPDMHVQGGMDPYAQMVQPGFDPSMIPLINSPSTSSYQVIQAMTDNAEIIQQFKDGLRGWKMTSKFNPQTETMEPVKEVFAEPAMNETGVGEIGRDLEMYLSKPFIMTNFPTADKSRIDMMMVIIGKNLAQKMIINSVKYELDKSRRGSIVRQIVLIVWANTMRGFEDGERPRAYGSHKTVQTINTQGNYQAPQKKNWLGF